jgi:hypothetical protein
VGYTGLSRGEGEQLRGARVIFENRLMIYSFTQIGTTVGVYAKNPGLWIRLREQWGKRHAMCVAPDHQIFAARIDHSRHHGCHA